MTRMINCDDEQQNNSFQGLNIYSKIFLTKNHMNRNCVEHTGVMTVSLVASRPQSASLLAVNVVDP